MTQRNQIYEDQTDRKAKIAERRHRDEIREADMDKYLAEEDENPRSTKRAARQTEKTGRRPLLSRK